MSDLGNVTDRLRLHCKRCGWPPPETMTTRDAQLHFQVDHDTDEITFDLAPVCPCGEPMTPAGVSKPTGGGFKDYFACGACGSTGHVVRRT